MRRGVTGVLAEKYYFFYSFLHKHLSLQDTWYSGQISNEMRKFAPIMEGEFFWPWVKTGESKIERSEYDGGRLLPGPVHADRTEGQIGQDNLYANLQMGGRQVRGRDFQRAWNGAENPGLCKRGC